MGIGSWLSKGLGMAGSAIPGVGPALNAIGTGGGLLGGLFGGGPSEEERRAMAQLQDQMNRSNRFWEQAQGDAGAARRYWSPMLGGNRQAMFESVAPEVEGATQRMDMGRKSLLNLGSRSGGAAAMIDPYAKGSVASKALMQVRPQAATQMGNLAQMTGNWAQNQGQATQQYGNMATQLAQRKSDMGKGMFDSLTNLGGFLTKQFPQQQKTSSSFSTGGLSGLPFDPSMGSYIPNDAGWFNESGLFSGPSFPKGTPWSIG